MLEYALYEILYRKGNGFRCPRCHTYHGYADGFGVSRCHNCKIYYSVMSGEPVARKVTEFLKWIKEIFAKVRGK
ncbi:MAG: hypothetical protein AB7T49_06725 [Oligoflexales bacterium]